MLNVVFLHGLNTFGDDDLHVGPLRFGLMHSPWQKALAERGCEVLPLTGLGANDPVPQAERALEKIERSGWDTKNELHLIGHSTGGLTARALAPLLGTKVKTVLTVGTPHAGTNAADFGLAFERDLPRVQRLFARFGYDTRKKNAIFTLFTPEAMAKFNASYPETTPTRFAYALCEAKGAELSWPLLIFYSRLHPRAEDRGVSDGFIRSASQAWGRCLGRYRLDHFGNLGFFMQLDPRARRAARAEFEKLVDDSVSFLKDPVSI